MRIFLLYAPEMKRHMLAILCLQHYACDIPPAFPAREQRFAYGKTDPLNVACGFRTVEVATALYRHCGCVRAPQRVMLFPSL